jgi:uncharacterized RDD family membrane protein YckC
MTQIPAGWYPDPDPDSPEPRGRRYWDGQQWTEHVAAPSGASAPAGQYAGAPPYPGAPYGSGSAAAATTPDGQPLAGWWRRVGAYLIDWLILLVATAVLGWSQVRQIGSAYGDLLRETVRATENGSAMPDQGDLLADLGVPFLVLSLIALVLNFVYNVAFLKWKAATPGKLALGMRVRLREVPGPLSWGTVLLRWLAQNWYSVLGSVPVLGGVLAIYPVVDDLWPLWDPHNQALHDKVARTNVVRVR